MWGEPSIASHRAPGSARASAATAASWPSSTAMNTGNMPSALRARVVAGFSATRKSTMASLLA